MTEQLELWTEGDIPQLVAIEQQAYDFPWTSGNFKDSLYGPHQGLILRQAQQILGYAVYQIILDEMHLLNLVVDPAHQGKGYGSRILKHLVDLAREAHCRGFFLEVRASNQRAQYLYEHQGFASIARRRDYYPALAGREDAIIMELKL